MLHPVAQHKRLQKLKSVNETPVGTHPALQYIVGAINRQNRSTGSVFGLAKEKKIIFV